MSPNLRAEPCFDEAVLREITSAAGMAPWELIEMFLDDARQSVATITQSVASADTESINRTSHMLKSSAGSVGAMRIAEIAKDLERVSKSPVAASDPNAWAALGLELQQAFDEFCEAMENDRSRLSV